MSCSLLQIIGYFSYDKHFRKFLVLCVPVKEFNRVKLRYVSDETEIVYTFKGSFFGIPIYLN